MSYGDYPDLQNIKKILVIKLRHLGDVLVTTPLLANLKKRFPRAEIDCYIYKEAAPILEDNPHISTLLFRDSSWKKLPLFKRLLKELHFLRMIKKRGYDLVVNLTEGDRGAIATKASKARVRVGYDQGPKKRKKIYTHLTKVCPSDRHRVERDLDQLRRIGIFPAPSERALEFYIPPAVKQKILQNLKKWNFEEYILIHPASRWRFKCWPTDLTKKLIQKLLQEGHKLLLVSGKDPVELKMIEEITQGISHPNLHNLAGKTTIKELAAYIELSSNALFVDSVAAHIASALGAKCSILFGPTSEKMWGPWMNPKARVISKKISCRPCYMDGCGGSKMADCLHTLSADKVYEELLSEGLLRTHAGV